MIKVKSCANILRISRKCFNICFKVAIFSRMVITYLLLTPYKLCQIISVWWILWIYKFNYSFIYLFFVKIHILKVSKARLLLLCRKLLCFFTYSTRTKWWHLNNLLRDILYIISRRWLIILEPFVYICKKTLTSSLRSRIRNIPSPVIYLK